MSALTTALQNEVNRLRNDLGLRDDVDRSEPDAVVYRSLFRLLAELSATDPPDEAALTGPTFDRPTHATHGDLHEWEGHAPTLEVANLLPLLEYPPPDLHGPAVVVSPDSTAAELAAMGPEVRLTAIAGQVRAARTVATHLADTGDWSGLTRVYAEALAAIGHIADPEED